jgi:AcrR family transcriptional regulator
MLTDDPAAKPRKTPEMPRKSAPAPDHRTRVAADKRARMRRKLVESAVLIFAEKGVDAAVIDDVIVAAGVSRGTFYNYFRTNAELLEAANEELMNEILALIEARVGEAASPAARLCLGLRLYLDVARRFPLFARFLTRVGLSGLGPGNKLFAYVPVHIAAAMKAGQFRDIPMQVALDLIAGTMITAVARIARGDAGDRYLSEMLTTILRALGLPEPISAPMVAQQLKPLALDPDTLCVRSHVKFESHAVK